MSEKEFNLPAVLVGMQLTLVAIYLAALGTQGSILSEVSILLAGIGTLVAGVNLY